MRLPGHRPPCLTGIDPEWAGNMPVFSVGRPAIPRKYRTVIYLLLALVAWQVFIDAWVIGYIFLR